MKKLILILTFIFLLSIVGVNATELSFRDNCTNATSMHMRSTDSTTCEGAEIYIGNAGTVFRSLQNWSHVCDTIGSANIDWVILDLYKTANQLPSAPQIYPINLSYECSTIWTAYCGAGSGCSGGTSPGEYNGSFNLTVSNTPIGVNTHINFTLNATWLYQVCNGLTKYDKGIIIKGANEAVASFNTYTSCAGATVSQRPTLHVSISSDSSPPILSDYNLTSDGGCGVWNTDINNICETEDTTPTVKFDTDENANCGIYNQDLNYTDMGVSNECAGGQATTSHTCSLDFELPYDTEYIYIACEDLNGNGNGTSSSGGLATRIKYDIVIEAYDSYDGSYLGDFTGALFNDTFSETKSNSGDNITFFNKTGNYDLNLSATNYLNKSYFLNTTVRRKYNLSLTQALMTVNATELVTGKKIYNFTINFPPTKSTTDGNVTFELQGKSYTISANATDNDIGYYNLTQGISIENLTHSNLTLEFYTTKLNITAWDTDNSQNLTDFEVIVTNTDSHSWNKALRDSDGTARFNLTFGNYSLRFEKTDYATQTINYLINKSNHSYQFQLEEANSVHLTIRDEQTNEIITKINTTVRIRNESKTYSYSVNGTKNIYNLSPTLWDFKLSSLDYYPRTYFLTMPPAVSIDLTTWLLNTSEGQVITFTIRDKATDSPVTNALMTVTSFINTSYITVEQKRTDFSGVSKHFLEATTIYRIIIVASGYDTKTIDLEPSTTSYTVYLDKTRPPTFIDLIYNISYSLIPTSEIIPPQNDTNFSITLSSPTSILEFFGLTVQSGTENKTNNISVSISGGTAQLKYNLSNETGNYLTANYFIKATSFDLVEFSRTYRVYTAPTPDVDISSESNLMSIGERYKSYFSPVVRVLIAVFSSLAIMITITFLGVPAVFSGIVGLLIMSFFAFIDWINKVIIFILFIIVLLSYLLRRND